MSKKGALKSSSNFIYCLVSKNISCRIKLNSSLQEQWLEAVSNHMFLQWPYGKWSWQGRADLKGIIFSPSDGSWYPTLSRRTSMQCSFHFSVSSKCFHVFCFDCFFTPEDFTILRTGREYQEPTSSLSYQPIGKKAKIILQSMPRLLWITAIPGVTEFPLSMFSVERKKNSIYLFPVSLFQFSCCLSNLQTWPMGVKKKQAGHPDVLLPSLLDRFKLKTVMMAYCKFAPRCFP